VKISKTPPDGKYGRLLKLQQSSMRMSLFEKSECFRAFLLLVGVDGQIASDERQVLLTIGKKLDFEYRFCETAIDDLLENRFISSDPPIFSRKEIAESFLRDGIRIAFLDDQLHPNEADWLARIAQRNGLSVDWIGTEIAALQKRRQPISCEETMEIEKHI
jgi:hypothetical protein